MSSDNKVNSNRKVSSSMSSDHKVDPILVPAHLNLLIEAFSRPDKKDHFVRSPSVGQMKIV
jgi:hypothetical protein